MIEAVLFDFGGVLTPGGRTSVSKLVPARLYGLSAEAIQVDDLDALFAEGKISLDEYFDCVHSRYGAGKPVLTRQRYIETADIFERNQEVYELAANLRSRNIKTGILSNVTAVNSHLLREGGYYNDFSPVVLSWEAGTRKPDRRIYETVLGQIGIAAAHVLFIDDQSVCLEIAREMGI